MTSRPVRHLSLALATCLLIAAALSAAGQGRPKKPQTPPPPAAAAPPPPSADAALAATLDQVGHKILAYATAEARSELGETAKKENARVVTALGRILEQEKSYAESAAQLRKAGQMAPADPAPWAYLGESYLRQKKTGDATAAFRETEKRAAALVAKDPQNAEALYFLGLARQYLGQTGTARETLEKARRLDPKNPRPVFQLGVSRVMVEQWQEAVDLLTAALELHPDFAYAYYYRGLAAAKLGKKDLLIADLERFLKLAPNAPEAPIARRTVASAGR